LPEAARSAVQRNPLRTKKRPGDDPEREQYLAASGVDYLLGSDLDELVEQEQTSGSLAPARDNLHEAARDYISHLRRERDEYDDPHKKEAQIANDEYEAAETKFDKLRAIRQRKINIAVFSPGEVSREVEENLTDAEREYVEKISEADEKLRRISVNGDGVGQTVEAVR